MYGGSCPKCFGEIPGEEAATDPGEVVKAEQDRSDNRRKLVKTMIPLLLAVPMLGMLALLTLFFIIWNRNPTVETMVFDDIEEFQYAIVSTPEPVAEPEKVVTKVVKPRPTNGGRHQDVDSNGLPKVMAEKAVGGLSFSGLGVNTRRSSETLTDPNAIRKMIAQDMRKYGAQLKLCYDKRLKIRTDLEGRWRAKFIVQPNGFATNVSFKGIEMKDAEMEKCMVSRVKSWRFRKIIRPQPVEKNWRFRK